MSIRDSFNQFRATSPRRSISIAPCTTLESPMGQISWWTGFVAGPGDGMLLCRAPAFCILCLPPSTGADRRPQKGFSNCPTQLAGGVVWSGSSPTSWFRGTSELERTKHSAPAPSPRKNFVKRFRRAPRRNSTTRRLCSRWIARKLGYRFR